MFRAAPRFAAVEIAADERGPSPEGPGPNELTTESAVQFCACAPDEPSIISAKAMAPKTEPVPRHDARNVRAKLLLRDTAALSTEMNRDIAPPTVKLADFAVRDAPLPIPLNIAPISPNAFNGTLAP